MIQKVQNILTEITEDQLEIEWAQVLSKRNKLLEISDWTQLDDVHLFDDVKKEWSLWRHKLRNVNRNTYNNIQEIKDILALLEKEIPKSSEIDENAFIQHVVNTKKIDNKITHTVVTKEQPIVIYEKIEEFQFKELLQAVLEKDAYWMKEYLLSFLSTDHVNVLTEKNLDAAKGCAIRYLNVIQKRMLDSRLVNKTDYRIMQCRADEAIEYFCIKNPDVNDFPLIALHAQQRECTSDLVATDFLERKREYNRTILDIERFIMHTDNQINKSSSVEDIQLIIDRLNNGY